MRKGKRKVKLKGKRTVEEENKKCDCTYEVQVFFLDICLKLLTWNDGGVIKLRGAADINVCLY